MTTRELAAYHRERERASVGPLWRWAHKVTADVCETYPRGRARARLAKLARDFSHMSLSGVFEGAASTLAVSS